MFTLDEIRDQWIPYRLQAIETLQFAWSWASETDRPRSVQVVVEGRVRIQGNVAAVANPMIEAGILHARALLEFLGLCVSDGRLAQVRKRRPDDVAIEHYSNAACVLYRVTPGEAVTSYLGPPQEAEEALLAIFELANKGLAHVTSGGSLANYSDTHVDIACRGIPALITSHLYARLGRQVPEPPSAVPNGA